MEELKCATPVKRLNLDDDGGVDEDGAVAGQPPRTPTSSLLARTLRSELKRRQSVSEKLEAAQGEVARLRDELSDVKMDVEEAKADNALLEDDFEEKCVEVERLEKDLEAKDDQIARLNEEIEMMCHEVEGGASSADVVEGSESFVAESSSKSSDSERETASMLEERLDAVEETLEFTDGELTETKARLADAVRGVARSGGRRPRTIGGGVVRRS